MKREVVGIGIGHRGTGWVVRVKRNGRGWMYYDVRYALARKLLKMVVDLVHTRGWVLSFASSEIGLVISGWSHADGSV